MGIWITPSVAIDQVLHESIQWLHVFDAVFPSGVDSRIGRRVSHRAIQALRRQRQDFVYDLRLGVLDFQEHDVCLFFRWTFGRSCPNHYRFGVGDDFFPFFEVSQFDFAAHSAAGLGFGV